MENENSGRFESVYSSKVRAGRRRTYFFDVRKTKGGDFYVTLTESTKKFEGDGYQRHKIFLYKEDFNRFKNALSETIDHVKTELMPDYDYEQFERRQAEWEAQQLEEEKSGGTTAEKTVESTETKVSEETKESETATPAEGDKPNVESEDDMAW